MSDFDEQLTITDYLKSQIKIKNVMDLTAFINSQGKAQYKQIEDIKKDMCDNYCKMPYRYSANEWEEIVYSDDSPCNNCPLNRL